MVCRLTVAFTLLQDLSPLAALADHLNVQVCLRLACAGRAVSLDHRKVKQADRRNDIHYIGSLVKR